jgi:hypothetical protein
MSLMLLVVPSPSPLVFYGCKTWRFTLKEYRLRIYEKRVLCRVFVFQTNSKRQLKKNAHCGASYVYIVIKSSGMRWLVHVAHMGQLRSVPTFS